MMECAGTLFQKFFLRRMQMGTVSGTFFFSWHQYNLTYPSPTEFCVTMRSGTNFFVKKNSTRYTVTGQAHKATLTLRPFLFYCDWRQS
jgi:hypothetical protein